MKISFSHGSEEIILVKCAYYPKSFIDLILYAILIKIPIEVFTVIEKNPKICIEPEKTPNIKSNPEKEEQS